MQTSDWVVYAVLDSLAGLFESYITKILEEAEALEELVDDFKVFFS